MVGLEFWPWALIIWSWNSGIVGHRHVRITYRIAGASYLSLSQGIDGFRKNVTRHLLLPCLVWQHTLQIPWITRRTILSRSCRSWPVSRRRILVSFAPSCRPRHDIDPDSLTLWYPRHKLQYRVGLFFGAATVAGDEYGDKFVQLVDITWLYIGACSGLFAFAISFMEGVGGLESWSWIFVSYVQLSSLP